MGPHAVWRGTNVRPRASGTPSAGRQPPWYKEHEDVVVCITFWALPSSKMAWLSNMQQHLRSYDGFAWRDAAPIHEAGPVLHGHMWAEPHVLLPMHRACKSYFVSNRSSWFLCIELIAFAEKCFFGSIVYNTLTSGDVSLMRALCDTSSSHDASDEIRSCLHSASSHMNYC